MTPRRSPTSRLAGGPSLFAVVSALVLAAMSGSATSDAARSQQAPRSFPGGPYFTVVCGFSHRNNDDPIRFPGQPGRSHNHTYIGNRTVDASTTAASLLGRPTTCDVDEDASTYWVPTVFAGPLPIAPMAGIVYYTKHVTAPVAAPPPGLKMVAGNPTARKAQNKNIVSWSCGGIGGRTRYAAIPTCARDDALELEVWFPNCWNGRTTDSGNHRRHMAYSKAGRCPATHPVALPTVTVILLYPPLPRGSASSAGKWASHADFINGWDQEALGRLASGLNAQR